MNNYDIDESTTAKVQYANGGNTFPKEQAVDFGSFSFEGEQVKDQFCLNKNQFCV